LSLGSSIEWTQSTWNPLTGCNKISLGCENCYAERMSRRLQAMGHPNYANGFRVTLHQHMLEAPLLWRRPQLIFVNSMSDLFHELVPDWFILKTFATMLQCERHRFQVLTKRSARLSHLAPLLPWPANIWMGVSVETSEYAFRIDDLKQTPAKVKFISFEPLLGPVQRLDLEGIDWVIVGGESGPQARPVRHEWVASVRDMCTRACVPFFFKQWGGRRRKSAGRFLDGRTWEEMPRNNRIVAPECAAPTLQQA